MNKTCYRPDDIVFNWKHSMENEFRIDLNNIFQTINIKIEPASGHTIEEINNKKLKLHWWDKDVIKGNHIRLQKHIRGDLMWWPSVIIEDDRRGIKDTLQYLWEVRDNPDQICALLILASIFTRARSYREFPKREQLNKLEAWARKTLRNTSFNHWHHACTDVLPDVDSIYNRTIETEEDFINLLVSEHAKSLSILSKAIIVNFTAEGDPEILNIIHKEDEVIKAKKEAEELEWERTRPQREKEEKELEAERAAYKKEHPKAHKYHQLTAEILTKEVWTKSTEKVAKDYGVSGRAIGKLCASLNVSKPPVGFWAKVHAGKIKHPNGINVLKQGKYNE